MRYAQPSYPPPSAHPQSPSYPPPPAHPQPLPYLQPADQQLDSDGAAEPWSEVPAEPEPAKPEPGGPQADGARQSPAGFGARVTSFAIDAVAPSAAVAVLVFAGVAAGGPEVLAVAGGLGLAAFWVWNSGYRQGSTGQSIGRQVARTRLVKIETGEPVGFGTALLRQLCHGATLGAGYLWPLWDERRQTVADKIVGTLVVGVGDGADGGPAQRAGVSPRSADP